jgi:tetratricopeptide (TPR) repeat protein
MEELCEAARPLFRQYRSICLYGFSMGAYGAIKYSRMIGAQTVVAFSPQHTIDPAQAYASRSYTRFFDQQIHRDVTIQPQDLGGNIFVFYDPFHKSDYHAVGHIASCGDIRKIPVPFVGHTSVVPFTEARKGLDILRLCMEGDVGPLYRLSREVRRGCKPRLGNMVFAMVARHPLWALSLCRNHAEILYGPRLERFARKLKMLGKLDLAIRWAQAIVRQEPANVEAMRRLATFLREAGHFPQAKEIFKRALAVQPDNYQFLLCLSQICQKTQEDDEALAWARQAVAARPRDGMVFVQWIGLLQERGLEPELRSAVLEALKYHPTNPKFIALDAALREKQPA